MINKSFAAALGAAALLACAPMTASADTALEIALPGTEALRDVTTTYDCGHFTMAARYINSGQVSLVTLEWPDNFVVASQLIAASGARYAAGPYVWWEKGGEATFFDVTKDDGDEGIACTSEAENDASDTSDVTSDE